VYRGEVLRSDRSGLGARMVHTDRVEIDVGFSASLPASSNDIELRRGMPDLGTLIEFGPRLKLLLAAPAPDQRFTLEVPLRAVLEFNGGVRQQGYAFEPKLAFEQSLGGEWRIKSAFSVVAGDTQLNQYFYSVPSAYATASRLAFDAQSGLISTRLTIDGSRRLGPDFRLSAFARQDFMTAQPTGVVRCLPEARALRWVWALPGRWGAPSPASATNAKHRATDLRR